MSKVPTLIPYHDLKAKGVSYSKPHLWRLERDGKLPKRVPTGPARYAYVESEIDAYQTALIAARDAAPQNRSCPSLQNVAPDVAPAVFGRQIVT
jgi:prophage regulatory protein